MDAYICSVLVFHWVYHPNGFLSHNPLIPTGVESELGLKGMHLGYVSSY